MDKLTEFQKEVHQQLCEKGVMRWVHTSNQESRALNALIKNGYATYDGVNREWLPIRT